MKAIRRLAYWLRQRRHAKELAEEIEFHRGMKEGEFRNAGMGACDAAAAATRAMGNTTLLREEARAVWILPWIESIWQDVTYAVRNLRRQPGFTLLVIAVLGSAIGINTSLFTTFNAIALRPWPIQEPGRMVRLYSVLEHPTRAATVDGFSLAEYRFLAQGIHSFSGLIAWRQDGNIHFGFESTGKRSTGSFVSGNFFQTLGVQMERGRPFLPEEDRIEAPQRVAILSYLNWQNHFNADDSIVGRTVRIDDEPFTVVGVASRDFQGLKTLRDDVWIPLAAIALLRPQESSVLRRPDRCCSNVAGRLAPGVSREQARAELELLRPRFELHAAERSNRVLLTGTSFFSSPDADRQNVVPMIALMFSAVTLVLLLACANVGNLLLARAAARRQEIGIRVSLGAGRMRLIRQLLTESFVLALFAAAAGMAIAYRLPAYLYYKTSQDATSFRFTLDGRVLLYTVALAVISTVAFGLAPALHGTRTAGFGRVRLSLRNMLMAVQVAMSVVLLIGAGLLVRGVQHARSMNPGFAVDDVNVVSFELPANSYGAPQIRNFVSELDQSMRRTSAVPYGFTLVAPLERSRWWTNYRLPGEPKSSDRLVMMLEVSAGYFDVLRIPILTGRNLEPSDAQRKNLLVNESLARRCWPNANAIGKVLIVNQTPHEVVGVVKDAYTSGLDHIEPTYYTPVSGHAPPQMVIRNLSDLGGPKALSALVSRIEPRCRVSVMELKENVARWLEPARIGSVLAGVLGLLALILANIGLFGVFAYVVQQRTPELGIRMALGARWTQMVRVALGDSARAIAIGLAAGFGLAAAASRLLREYLYGLAPLDPVAYGVVIVTLIVAGLAATVVPARRVSKIDPMRALHYE